MSTPAERIAQEMRNEMEARLNSAKRERAALADAAQRIVELDALIAYLEDENHTSIPIAPRPPPRPPLAEPSTTPARTR